MDDATETPGPERASGSMDRRSMLLAASATSAGVAAAALSGPAQAETAPMTLRHQVYFWLKRPGNAEDRAALIAGLRKLAAVPVVRALYIGVSAPTESRDVVDNSFDVSEHMLFGSLADQKTYQDHPLHTAFVKELSHLWQRVVVHDSIDV